MNLLRWEDIGEWLEPPRTDNQPRAFRHKDGRKVWVIFGYTVPGTCVLDSHENIEKRLCNSE